MNSALKTMNSALKTMDFVLKVMDFATQNCEGARAAERGVRNGAIFHQISWISSTFHQFSTVFRLFSTVLRLFCDWFLTDLGPFWQLWELVSAKDTALAVKTLILHRNVWVLHWNVWILYQNVRVFNGKCLDFSVWERQAEGLWQETVRYIYGKIVISFLEFSECDCDYAGTPWGITIWWRGWSLCFLCCFWVFCVVFCVFPLKMQR